MIWNLVLCLEGRSLGFFTKFLVGDRRFFALRFGSGVRNFFSCFAKFFHLFLSFHLRFRERWKSSVSLLKESLSFSCTLRVRLAKFFRFLKFCFLERFRISKVGFLFWRFRWFAVGFVKSFLGRRWFWIFLATFIRFFLIFERVARFRDPVVRVRINSFFGFTKFRNFVAIGFERFVVEIMM